MKKSKLLMAIVFAVTLLISVVALTACSHSCVFDREEATLEYLASPYPCGKNTLYYKSCKKCGKSSKGEKGEATFSAAPCSAHGELDSTDRAYCVQKETCATEGIYYKVCKVCHEATDQTYTVSKLEHDYKEVATIDSTEEYCSGHHYVTICSMCDNVKSTTAKQPVKSEYWEVVKEPTVSSKGILEGICSECNKPARVSLAELKLENKSFYNSVEILDACDEEGVIRYTYERDGQTFVFEDDNCPVRHSIGSGEIYEEEFDIETQVLLFDNYDGITLLGGKVTPTCSVKGENAVFYCKRCDTTYKIRTRTEHETPEEYVIEKATCDELEITFNCEACNDPNAEKIIPGIGHKMEYVLSPIDGNFNNFKLEYICLNMLEDAEHDEKFVCSHVDKNASIYGIKKEDLTKIDATCLTGTIYNYTHEGKVYSYNDGVKQVSHLYVSSEDGKGYRLESEKTYFIDKCPGIKILGNQEEIPVCDNRGREAVFSCSECGFAYRVRVIKEKHQKPISYVRPTSDCTEVVYGHYDCDRCGESCIEPVNPEGHIYTYVVTVAPTRETEGEARLTCSRCGEGNPVIIKLPVLPVTDNSSYSVDAEQKETCSQIGKYDYTYHYKYTIEVYDDENNTIKHKTLILDIEFKHVQPVSDHINPTPDEYLEIRLDGKIRKGFICSECGKFIIVE